MKLHIPFLLIFSLLLVGGCVTNYKVRVDALSSDQGPVRGVVSYELASSTPGVETGDLFFKEVTRFLKPVLANQGFRMVQEGEQPDLLIEVDAHISEPMTETESYAEPLYYETRSRYRTVRVPVINSEGKVVRYAYSSYWMPSRLGVAGWVDNNRQVTVYDKVLRLSAREVLDDGTYGHEQWVVTVALRDESTDYRSKLVYMLVAAEPYIGKRTDGEEVITIRQDAENVQALQDSLSDGR